MPVVLDLADIQGNVLNAYGKQGYPVGRFMLFHIPAAHGGRRFVMDLLPLVTTAQRWTGGDAANAAVPRPRVAVNIAFTFPGLVALETPTRTLRGLPDEFIDGMAKRAPMLGDDYHRPASDASPNSRAFLESWDKVWRPSPNSSGPLGDDRAVHILVTLNAGLETLQVTDKIASPAMEETTDAIKALAIKHGVTLLEGHSLDGAAPYQDLSAIFARDDAGQFLLDDKGLPIPQPTEHFGFVDGISDPVFEGQYPDESPKAAAIGGGALDESGNWRPLATGEFLLGYPDEAQEPSGGALPLDFCRNGTFMAYRKLHQNVDAWDAFIAKSAEGLAKSFGIASVADARELLLAKMAGRWSDGVPTALASTLDEWRAFNAQYPKADPRKDRAAYDKRASALVDFGYAKDLKGSRCPMTSHVRRVNTRDGLDPIALTDDNPTLQTPATSVLNNRRRILRRGLPYGGGARTVAGSDDRGIVMLVVCADLFRQFEFVQQQWINYGLDSYSGNDTCPIVGNHSLGDAEPDETARKRNGPKAKFVVPAAEGSERPPYTVEGLPQFVETRGGDYFFIPSLTALSMIAMGTVDPT